MHVGMVGRRMLHLLLLWAVVLAGAAPALAQENGARRFSAASLRPDGQIDIGGVKERRAQRAMPGALAGAIVKLKGAPLASYHGGVAGLPATSPRSTGATKLDLRAPASNQYRAYLKERAIQQQKGRQGYIGRSGRQRHWLAAPQGAERLGLVRAEWLAHQRYPRLR